jgi:hypothetical protein
MHPATLSQKHNRQLSFLQQKSASVSKAQSIVKLSIAIPAKMTSFKVANKTDPTPFISHYCTGKRLPLEKDKRNVISQKRRKEIGQLFSRAKSLNSKTGSGGQVNRG